MRLIDSIVDKNFVEADSIISETVELIMARKLEEAKKMCAAKMAEQKGHEMNRTAAKLRSMDIAEEEDLEENYHSSYTSAIQTAIKHTEKRGYKVDPEDYDNKVATGPRKPSEGKTVSHVLKLTKDGKPSKKTLAVQVYNRGGDKTPYELNHYISEETLDEARVKIVKARIRGGKIQRRKKVSNVPGMTIRGGKLTRMSPAERRRRKMGQRRGKIKRKAKMNRAIMKRQRSIRKRKALGL